MANKLPRRVYRVELCGALGWSNSWFRMQQKRGVVQKGHTDPGGKREWFTEAEAKQILRQLGPQQAAA